ncbi:MAG TPA: hypothetical protein PLR71_09100 [Deltaproteobacteria bacterium]|nr:hypothetical protein [Deltaproteobacteria bacterium]HQI81703.1 hypothetical protein [Deltaproteobacteria bacterium]
MEQVLILCGLIAGGALVWYLTRGAPAPDMVCSSSSEEELERFRVYLEARGIATYLKNTRRFHETQYDLVNPSLHVVSAADLEKARYLLRDLAGTSPDTRNDRP